MTTSSPRRRTLILVENLSVPFDRRVWQESLALRRAGYDVVVICPRGTDRDRERFEERDGIEIHRFSLPSATGGTGGYLREYGAALVQISRLVRKVSRGRRFDIVHACNPPDFLLLAALRLRVRGTRFIFDHHDLSPELYLSKFGDSRGVFYRSLLALERLTFRLAHVVISTNDSYARIASTRGGKSPDDVFVVRNAPDLSRFHAVDPEPSLRRGKRHLVVYLGMMGPQDGIDHAVQALAHLRARRNDWHAIFVGDGAVVPTMKELAVTLGVAENVEFTGLLEGADLLRVISSADVCLAPDPVSPLNDVSTMIKVVEYMAIGRPIVSYPLAETKISAGDAALYAKPNDPESFADGIDELLDDFERRELMGRAGQERAQDLSWERSVEALLAAYDRALDR